MYVDEAKGFFPHAGYQEHNPLDNHLSWKVMLAPYHGIKNLSSSDVDARVERGVYSCPSKGEKNCGWLNYGDLGYYGGYSWNWMYLGFLNQNYTYRNWVCVPFVNSGQLAQPSQTIMVQDTTDRYLPENGFINFYIYPDQSGKVVNRHNNGSNVLWADGHVSWHTHKKLDSRHRWYKRCDEDGWYDD